MDKVHVAIACELKKEHIELISSLDRRLKVWDIGRQATAERKNGRTNPDLAPVLGQAEVIFSAYPLPDVPERTPKLKWFHLYPVGVNRLAATEVWNTAVTITNSYGAPAVGCSEYVVSAMFMLARRTPLLCANQQKKSWQRFPATELCGKTVGIVGLGSIGKRVARAAKGLEMKVLAVRRSQTAPGSKEDNVDHLLPPGQLSQLLAASDFVVLSLPLTPETTRLIGRKELETMNPAACLINVSRGQIVDEAALISALKEGKIAGAALDVFEEEPLPPESELWELPNVIISPHTAGDSLEGRERHVQIFCENLKRYLAGQELINVVDRKNGY